MTLLGEWHNYSDVVSNNARRSGARRGERERENVERGKALTFAVSQVLDDLEAREAARSSDTLARVVAVKTLRVSLLAQALAAHAEQVLREACAAPPDCADALYNAVRHVFELYRALIPLEHEQTLTSAPTMASLFRNDCLFLTRTAIRFSVDYCPKLAAKHAPPQFFTFVDQIVPLRELADFYDSNYY